MIRVSLSQLRALQSAHREVRAAEITETPTVGGSAGSLPLYGERVSCWVEGAGLCLDVALRVDHGDLVRCRCDGDRAGGAVVDRLVGPRPPGSEVGEVVNRQVDRQVFVLQLDRVGAMCVGGR